MIPIPISNIDAGNTNLNSNHIHNNNMYESTNVATTPTAGYFRSALTFPNTNTTATGILKNNIASTNNNNNNNNVLN